MWECDARAHIQKRRRYPKSRVWEGMGGGDERVGTVDWRQCEDAVVMYDCIHQSCGDLSSLPPNETIPDYI